DFGRGAAVVNGQVIVWPSSGDAHFGPRPHLVSGISNAIAVGMTNFLGGRGCAVLVDGTVTCWNDVGVTGGTETPAAVSGVSGAVTVGVGRTHACALIPDGT